MRAVRFDQTGGPEVLRLVDVATPEPGPGQVRIRQASIGVNFIDTYHRTGLYPVPLPSGLGLEGAGVIEAIGEGVTRFAIGDRVGFCSGPIGAYAEAHVVAADRVVTIPDDVSFEIAAASMLKGMTARYLLRKTFPVERGTTIVVYAAAGGVGQILIQWGKKLGARVISVVGSDDKAAIADRLGSDYTIVSTRTNIAKAVREYTNGEGADVAYDSVGKDTFEATLDSLRPLGMFVSYGASSGPPTPFAPGILGAKGSLFFTRPSLFDYTRTPTLLQETADDLWRVIAAGDVVIAPPLRYALADVVQAHRDLEGRRTTGSVVLTP